MRVALAVAAVAATAFPAHAQGRLWREDERVIVSDFREVRALAATEARVYVATANGLGLYDRRFRRWDPPVTVADGYPRERVLAALADPTDDAVWLGTVTGVVRYRPLVRAFDAFVVPGGVRDLMVDRDNPFQGVFLLTSGGWELLPRGGFVPYRAPPPPPGRRQGSLSVDEVMRRQPVVDAMQGAVLLDQRLRTYRYTAAVVVPGTEEYYLGTDGLGVIRLDALVAQFEPLPFGLLAPGAGAVLAVPTGVWVGSDARGARSGLTFVGEDLQEYAYEEGPRGTGFGGAVRALLMRGREVWSATERGVVRTSPNGLTRRLTTANGLPDDESYALAQGPSGVWVGTAFGLGFLPADSQDVRVPRGPAAPVLALVAARDTVWIGSTAGLGVAVPGDEVRLARGADSVLELRGPIVAVTRLADTLVAATIDRLLWRAGAGPWQVERPLPAHLGAAFALAPDSGAVWIGAQGGLARYRFATRDILIFPAPGDVPGAVRGIAVTPRYLWLATEAGLVRFSRRALEP